MERLAVVALKGIEEAAHRVAELGGRRDAAHQPVALRRGRVDLFGGIDQPQQRLGRDAVHMGEHGEGRRDAALHFGQCEARVIGGDGHVAHRRGGTTEPVGQPLHHSDHRHLGFAHRRVPAEDRRHQRGADAERGGGAFLGRGGRIAALAEIIAIARQHDGLDRRIGAGLGYHGGHLAHHAEGQQIADIGAVDGEARDGAVLGESQFVGHGAGLSSVKNADGVVLKAGLDFRLAQPEYRGENPARVGAEGGRVAVPVLNGA